MALKLQSQEKGMGDIAKHPGSNALGISHTTTKSTLRATAFDQWMVRKMLNAIGDPAISIVLWDGTELTTSPAPTSVLTIHDRQALLSLLLDPEYYFGDLYSSGRVEVLGDFTEFPFFSFSTKVSPWGLFSKVF